MIRSVDPTSGVAFGPTYAAANTIDVELAVAKARRAADELALLEPATIAEALVAAAEALDRSSEELVTVANAETALGVPRLSGEVARTTSQLRSFADDIRDGRHLEIVISHLLAGAPARDLRRMNRPVGVVVVFAASNFPFAFSVAGGDTASALAAGCSVIVKAHPGHPQTSQRVGDLVEDALVSAGFPAHSLQVLHGEVETALALVDHPAVSAAGFTGSATAGGALSARAGRRPVPIPVYAEQGSVNPLLLGPTVFDQATDDVVSMIAKSVTLGWGQFCTKPGLLLVPEDNADSFGSDLRHAIQAIPPGHLLTEAIHVRYLRQLEVVDRLEGADTWHGPEADDGFAVPAVVTSTDVEYALANPVLIEEMFGPACVIIAVHSADRIQGLVEALGGNLTATVWGSPADPWVRTAVGAFTDLVGRVIYNGVPTGVAVDPAMQHGGPYPATNSPQQTSVGTAAITRFLRPVSYQDFPAALLPAALQPDNPWHLKREIRGTPATPR